MAEAITGRSDAAALLAELTSRNAFVKRLPDSDRYRCHHMLKDCAALAFQKLPEETRTLYYNRYGQWFETHGMLLHALYAYRNGKNYDALLRVTQKDAGILLCSMPPDAVLSTLAECPEKTLRAHPAALLVADALHVQLEPGARNAEVETAAAGRGGRAPRVGARKSGAICWPSAICSRAFCITTTLTP